MSLEKKRIVQINTVYGTGSTGKITASLYRSAKNESYETYVAYGRGNTPKKNNINGMRIGNKIDFLSHVMSNFFKGNSGFASKKVTTKFLNWLDEIHPDLIHIHNLHGFYINVEMLFNYVKENNIPVIWTLHDCWSFTGQCAYFDCANCYKWKTGCYDCPIYKSDYPYSVFKDNSKENYIAKRNIFKNVENLIIVTPSVWLENLVRLSFLRDYPTMTITNGINLDIFKPYDNAKELMLKYHQYDLDGKKVLLGVANVWIEQKGYKYMLELSKYFNKDNGYLIVLIGVSKKQQRYINSKYGDILAITRTNNQVELAMWYSVAHVYLNPTLQDNYPTTNLEAQACGTPVVTFDTGGSPETLVVKTLPNKVVSKGDIIAMVDAIKNIEDYSNVADGDLTLLRNEVFTEKYMNLYTEALSS